MGFARARGRALPGLRRALEPGRPGGLARSRTTSRTAPTRTRSTLGIAAVRARRGGFATSGPRRHLLPDPVAALEPGLRRSCRQPRDQHLPPGLRRRRRMERRGDAGAAGGGRAPSWRPPVDRLSLRFFAGPTPAGALRRFSEAVGRQPRATAPWVFGPWFQPGDEEAAELATLRDADAPVSVFQTYTHYLPCGEQETAAEQARTQAAHDGGVAITTYFNPMVCANYAARYDPAQAADALTETRAGTPYTYRYGANIDDLFLVGQYDFFEAGWARALRRRAGRGGWRRIRRLDGGLRRVHAARLDVGRDDRRQPRPQRVRAALPLRGVARRQGRAASDRPLPALGLDRRGEVRAGRVGRRSDDGLGLRRARVGGDAGAQRRDLRDRHLGLGHRRVLRDRLQRAHARAPHALGPVRRGLGRDANAAKRRRPAARATARR